MFSKSRLGVFAVLIFFVLGALATETFAPLPDFASFKHFEYSSPLYPTITLGRCDCVMSPNSQEIAITIPQMWGTIHGRKIVMREAGHELVIVFNGTGGLAESGFASYVMKEYEKLGMSSMTFDSPFSARYVAACGRGVPGNFRQDCYAIIDIINVFLKDSERRYGKNHYSKIGIVGLSMGAIDALLLPEVLAKLQQPPFEISGTIAICPPADMLEAAKILDEYGRLITPLHTVGGVYMQFHAEVASPERDNFFPENEMKFAVFCAFEHEFNEVKEVVFREYRKPLGAVCPDGTWKAKFKRWDFMPLPAEERRVFTDTSVRFGNYFANICVPYWSTRKLEPGQLLYDGVQIRNDGNLERLLSVRGGNAEVFLCANCPLSRKADVDRLKDGVNRGSFTTPLYVLNKGGHGGIVQTKMIWKRFPLIFETKEGGPGFVMEGQ